MTDVPFISIIVPIYNVESYLRECLDSICAQEGIRSEIILVDDGSTDCSGAICDEYARKHTKIRVIHKSNGGPASARNAGLDVMTGDYVAFVDSDDYIAPDMYRTLFEAMADTESRIACCGHFRVMDGKVTAAERPVTEKKKLAGSEIIRNLMLDKEMTYSPCDKLFQAQLFTGVRFPGGNLPSEDLPCLYSILKKAERVIYIGQAKYYYRWVKTSMTRKEFSPKNISTVHYTQEICGDVLKSFPEFRDEALFALTQCVASVYARMITDGKEKECKKEKRYMERLLWEHRKEIKKNPYLTRNAKLAALSIPLKSYRSLNMLRNLIKKGSKG